MITAIKIYLVLGFLSYVFFFLKGLIHPSTIVSFLLKSLLIGPFMVIKYISEEHAIEKRYKEKQKEKEQREKDV